MSEAQQEAPYKKWPLPEVLSSIQKEVDRISEAIAHLKVTLKDNGIEECGIDRSEQEIVLWADLLKMESDWIQFGEDAQKLKERPDIKNHLDYAISLIGQYYMLEHQGYNAIDKRNEAR